MNVHTGTLDGDGLTVAIVASRFNDAIVRGLVLGCEEALQRMGVAPDRVDLVWVPGAFEIPLAAHFAAASGRYDAVITLGCVIRGATPHFDYVAGAAANGVGRVALDTGVPIIFGVLTTDTIEQAIERAGTKAGNKGVDAAEAAVEMARLRSRLTER